MDDDQGSVAWTYRSYGQVELIAVSIVSHGHGAMVGRLVEALLDFPEVLQILVTLNIAETLPLVSSPRIKVINNSAPKGFGANHNAAFSHCSQDFFCPINPDVELFENPFSALISVMNETNASLGAPLVLSPAGDIEDSIRRFPTLSSLLVKFAGGGGGRYIVSSGQPGFHPDWVAGMFMLFRSEDYKLLGGFDERYFLYYEDVDICTRVWKRGMKVVVSPQVSVVHDAQRDSRRSLPHFRWHLTSMVRYFLYHWGRLPRTL